jgi:hypothetical protein
MLAFTPRGKNELQKKSTLQGASHTKKIIGKKIKLAHIAGILTYLPF